MNAPDPVIEALKVITEQLRGIRADIRGLIDESRGICVECGYLTEERHDDEWLCDECNDDLVRGQELDKFLDNPQRGQAADINRR